MRTILVKTGCMMVLLAWLAGTAAAVRADDTPSAARVRETAEETIGIDANTQQMMEEWVSEEQEMLDRIEALSAQIKQTRWQQEKNAAFIRTLEAKIESLQLRAAEIEKVDAELLPVLDTTLDRLSALVLSDIPASPDRRRKALARTREILDDYDTGLPGKTRAVFDTMAREVDLGHTVGVEEEEIEVNGQLRQVKVLRVGRIGLFAVTPDGQTGFSWDRSRERFVPLEGTARDLMEAVEMAEGIRLIGLSRLPMDLSPVQTEDMGKKGNSLAGREPAKGGNRDERN